MRKSLVIFAIAAGLVSCFDNDLVVQDGNQKSGLSFSEKEMLCIKDDITEDLSKQDIIELVQNYHSETGTSGLRSFSPSMKVFIKGIHYKTVDATGQNRIPTRSKALNNEDIITLYEVGLQGENGYGFSLVSADKRAPGVLAYVPVGNLSDTVENKSMTCMLDVANAVIANSVLEYNAVIDSLKEQTIDKICKFENISVEEYYNGNYTEKYTYTQTRSYNLQVTVIDLWKNFSPQLTTTWTQAAPYNSQVPGTCSQNTGTLGEKAPAGCVAIAFAQILTNLKCQPRDNSTTYNYDLLLK